MTDAAAAHAVDEAITSRHSIRAFLPTPVPRATIEAAIDAWRAWGERSRSARAVVPAPAAARSAPGTDNRGP